MKSGWFKIYESVVERHVDVEKKRKHQLRDFTSIGESGMVEYQQFNMFIDTA